MTKMVICRLRNRINLYRPIGTKCGNRNMAEEREAYRQNQLTRTERVQKQLSKRVRFQGHHENPSFIVNELFGREFKI